MPETETLPRGAMQAERLRQHFDATGPQQS